MLLHRKKVPVAAPAAELPSPIVLAAMLRSAHDEYALGLASGGFVAVSERPTGELDWSVAAIASHVVCASQLLEWATRDVAACGGARFDSRLCDDRDAMERFASAVGGLDRVARAVAVAGERLGLAVEGLNPSHFAVLVPARVVASGVTLVEGAIPLGDLLAATAFDHLPGHVAGLAALRGQ